MAVQIDNKSARHLFLFHHGLCINPAAACDKNDILDMIRQIGFVQLDSIRTVERAHHHILFARRQTYKHAMLTELLEQDRSLFENWTHDAAIIPSDFYCNWKHRFDQENKAIVKRWEKSGRKGVVQNSQTVIEHIRANGPTLARDLKPENSVRKAATGWWDWHPAKASMEYLWRTGKTAIAHRQGFQKAYDLAERVIPQKYLHEEISTEQWIDWACSSALDRLGFATHGELAAFWGMIPAGTAKAWVESRRSQLVEVEIQSFDRKSSKLVWARPKFAQTLDTLPQPSRRLRILSPFDPMLRDRKRAEFLFGFKYRIEVFVPQAKREYGYYVFPILQNDAMIGRIDMTADRRNKVLNIRRVWLERNLRLSKSRMAMLESELFRIARFVGLERLNFETGFQLQK